MQVRCAWLLVELSAEPGEAFAVEVRLEADIPWASLAIGGHAHEHVAAQVKLLARVQHRLHVRLRHRPLRCPRQIALVLHEEDASPLRPSRGLDDVGGQRAPETNGPLPFRSHVGMQLQDLLGKHPRLRERARRPTKARKAEAPAAPDGKLRLYLVGELPHALEAGDHLASP